MILDNGSTRKRNEDWLAKHAARIQFHFKPTSDGWLNQVEVWHGSSVRKALRRASFAGKDQLCAAIGAFARRTKKHTKPFHGHGREVTGSQLRHAMTNLCNQALA